MKTYYIMLSTVFPKNHRHKGNRTWFLEKIGANIKIHTIRGNYDLWEKRFDEIQNGKAILSLRIWQGKPYCSPQLEFFRLSAKDGIGIEKLTFESETNRPVVNGKTISIPTLAENDGLTYIDWLDWFKECDISKPLAIIHFTNFRYSL